jgi:hypothetical protein
VRMMITSSFAGNGDRVASRPRFSLLRPCSGPCYFSAVFQLLRAFLRIWHLAAPPFTGIYRDACKNAGQKYSGRGYVKRAKFRSETLPDLEQDDIRSNRHASACRRLPSLAAGIHVLNHESNQRRGWHRTSGLPEVRTINCRKSSKLDLRDKPGHDAGVISISIHPALACGNDEKPRKSQQHPAVEPPGISLRDLRQVGGKKIVAHPGIERGEEGTQR